MKSKKKIRSCAKFFQHSLNEIFQQLWNFIRFLKWFKALDIKTRLLLNTVYHSAKKIIIQVHITYKWDYTHTFKKNGRCPSQMSSVPTCEWLPSVQPSLASLCLQASVESSKHMSQAWFKPWEKGRNNLKERNKTFLASCFLKCSLDISVLHNFTLRLVTVIKSSFMFSFEDTNTKYFHEKFPSEGSY